MGCFFGAPSGAQQKELIRKYHIITRKMKLLEYTRQAQDEFINMNQFNSITRLFREGSDLEQYISFIEVFKKIKLTSLESRAIMSYLILFDYDASLNLSCKETLKKIESKKQEMFQVAFGKTGSINLQIMMSTLVKMSVFAAYNIQWDEAVAPVEKTGLTSFNVVLAYTDEEEIWLKKQMQHFDEAFFSVPIGEDLCREGMMHSLGDPLSKYFFNGSFAVFLERFFRVIKLNPEVPNLAVKDADQLKQNCKNALALCMVRMESCPDGMAQLQILSSEIDMNTWKDNFFPLFQDGRKVTVKKITLQVNKQFSQ